MLKRLRKYLDMQKVIREVGSFSGRGLVEAVEESNFACLEILIEAGMDVNSKSERGVPAAIRAIDKSNLPILRMLVEAEAEINERDPEGKTVLMRAIESGNKHIFTYLMEQAPDLEMTDPKGETALFVAIRTGHTTLARKLLEAGAEYETPNLQGCTPLMLAVDVEKVGIVKALLEEGADPSQTDRDGHTALERNVHNPRLTKLLRKATLNQNGTASGRPRTSYKDQLYVPLLWQKKLLKQFPQLSALTLGLADSLIQSLDAQDVLMEWELRGQAVMDKLDKEEASGKLKTPSLPPVLGKLTAALGNLLLSEKQPKDDPEETPIVEFSQEQLDQGLLEAIKIPSPALVQLCLLQGANPNIRNEAGVSAWELSEGHGKIQQLLVEAGATPPSSGA
ncbi:MAG: ankyrin repeat domain-containing protein [Bacteroidota bacterium]